MNVAGFLQDHSNWEKEMKNNENIKRTIAGLLMLVWCGLASAFSVALLPASATYGQGNPFALDLVVSGLGGDGPLSTYDIDIAFQSGVGYVGATSAGALGTSLFMAAPGTGSVNLFELSFELDAALASLQGGSFTLATLDFVGNTLGTYSFLLSANALGGAQVVDPQDPNGATITSDLLALGPTFSGAEVTIVQGTTPIPEPATGLLAGLALLALAGRRLAGVGA
jgi:hypothetical protein